MPLVWRTILHGARASGRSPCPGLGGDTARRPRPRRARCGAASTQVSRPLLCDAARARARHGRLAAPRRLKRGRAGAVAHRSSPPAGTAPHPCIAEALLMTQTHQKPFPLQATGDTIKLSVLHAPSFCRALLFACAGERAAPRLWGGGGSFWEALVGSVQHAGAVDGGACPFLLSANV